MVKKIAAGAALIALLSATHSYAQQVEGGIDLGGACRRTDASYCEDWTREKGAHVSVWLGQKVDIAFRAAFISFPDRTEFIASPNEVAVIYGRERRLLQGVVTYHFLNSRHVFRPLVGVAPEQRRERISSMCQPAACEEVPVTTASIRTSEFERSSWDVGVLAGASALFARRILIRTVFTFDDTPEFYVAVGYRIGRIEP